MARTRDIHIYEELLLLALRDEKGTIAASAPIDVVLGGAILAELLLEGRLSVSSDEKSAFVEVRSSEHLGDEILDECLSRVVEANRRARLKNWVRRFSRTKQIKRRAAEGLCDKGILRNEKQQVLLFFNRTVIPEVDPRPERALIQRLRRAISNDGPVEPRTAVLIALGQGAGVLKNGIEKRILKERKARIRRIAKGDAVGRATKEVIEAIHAAVVVAAVLPAVVTTST